MTFDEVKQYKLTAQEARERGVVLTDAQVAELEGINPSGRRRFVDGAWQKFRNGKWEQE